MAHATVKSAPDCGLYVALADDFAFETTVKQLQQVFFVPKKSVYKNNMHVLELPGLAASAAREEEIKGLVGYARQSGFVAIIRDHPGHAGAWQSDGVILRSVGDIAATRAALGADAIIGVECGPGRDVAESVLLQGVDYVSFGLPGNAPPPVDLLSWWSTRTDVPAVARGMLTDETCGVYVSAGATFVDVGDFILSHPKGALQGTADALYAIEQAIPPRDT